MFFQDDLNASHNNRLVLLGRACLCACAQPYLLINSFPPGAALPGWLNTPQSSVQPAQEALSTLTTEKRALQKKVPVASPLCWAIQGLCRGGPVLEPLQLRRGLGESHHRATLSSNRIEVVLWFYVGPTAHVCVCQLHVDTTGKLAWSAGLLKWNAGKPNASHTTLSVAALNRPNKACSEQAEQSLHCADVSLRPCMQ